MKQKFFLALLGALVLTLSLTSATCTVTFGKESYVAGETITAGMACSTTQEKNTAYTLNWTYQNGTSVELDTGTTPATVSENFYQTYNIPSSWPNGIFINATLQGTDLEGTDSANISSTGASNALIITNATIGGRWLGLTSSASATVKDENGKKITGGNCKISAWSNDETVMLLSKDSQMLDGIVKIEGVLDYRSFEQNKGYVATFICYCGSTGSPTECIDQDGTAVQNSIGTGRTSFTTRDWVSVLEYPVPITYENGTYYPNATIYAGFGEKVHMKANVTNNYPEGAIEIKNKGYLVNNATGSIFEDARGNIERSYSVPSGNKTVIAEFEVPSNAPTGVYFVRNFLNTYYNNLLVSQAILSTETFNVTGTSDSFQITQLNVDRTNLYTGQHLHACANITNNFDTRVEFEIYYNYRCGSSGNFATDRAILDEHREFRAISAGTSQYQCASLQIPYEDHILYQTSQCYASVTIQSDYINTFDNKLSVTSSQFNITDYGMYPEYELDSSYPIIRLFPDWRRFDDVIDGSSKSYYRAKVNITKLNESYLDPDNEIGDSDWDIYVLFNEIMPPSKEIYNYTVNYANGTQIENTIENKELNWKTEIGETKSRASIGIEDVNFSDTNDDYFEVFLYFEDFEERYTKSLEALNTSWNTAASALVGIENKTGTFHLDVQCPSSAELGSEMNCSITGQIEDEQTVQKEVDFTCYITGDGNIYSSLNFNQMITRTPTTLYQTFLVPTTLTNGQQYTLQCHADYYNLGSRRDSFYDTFTAGTIPPTSSGSSSTTTGWGNDNIQDTLKEKPEEEKAPITGGIIGTISLPSTKTILTASIILIAIIIITYFFIPSRKHHYPKPKYAPQSKHFKLDHKILFAALNLLALIIAIAAIVFLIQTFTSLGETSQIIQDPLLQKIIFITFLAAITILLFKALNIQINISFNNQNPVERYWKQIHRD